MSTGSRTPWFVERDGAWTGRLSPVAHQIRFEHDLAVRVRDGTRLSADVWRPRGEGRFPVVFVYTPYDNAADALIELARYFVPRGYAFVAIDVRGRYDSAGDSYLYWQAAWREGRFDGEDVFDCLTWIGEQSWSTGRVGMTGGSYLGFVQWLVAPMGHPNLATIVPYVSPDDHWDNVYPGGALQLSNSVNLLAILGEHAHTRNETLRAGYWDWQALYRHLPLRTLDEALFGQSDRVWQDLVDHATNDEYWRLSVGERLRSGEEGPGQYADVRIPSLNITGWYDQVSQATINNWLGMVHHGPPELRGSHHLIVGPWTHSVGPRRVGDLDFGPDAEVDFRPIELRWYDRWLKGIDNGLETEPPVSLFVMGEDAWRTEAGWPPADAVEQAWHLHGGGAANGRTGDGRLGTEPAGVSETADHFTYDPADPVPTSGGNISVFPPSSGPRDQRAVEDRSDVLVYAGPPLEEDLAVAGRILAELFATTSAPDTDFTAKLVDEHPDGYAQVLVEGIIRARFRDSFREPRPVVPGAVERYVIDLWSLAHVFRRGHRVVLEVSSSNFPKYDRNPNTGAPFGADAELRVAEQAVHHDAGRPSRIILPVRPAPGSRPRPA
jgi:hypothetical protein